MAKMIKNAENYITSFILIAFILTIGYVCAVLAGRLYYGELLDKLVPQTNISGQYEKQINSSTDATSAAKIGMAFLKTNSLNNLSLSAFAKATVLDPKWRDGWVWKGDAELKNNQPQNALTSLKTAEALDPIYPLTYQLLAVAYEETGDMILAENAQEKLTYLNKTYKK